MRIALSVSLVASLSLSPALGAEQRPAPAASAELSGSVVDESGRPVAGAQVRVAPFADGHGGLVIEMVEEDGQPTPRLLGVKATVRTATDGSFLASGLYAGWAYDVVAFGTGHAPSFATFVVPVPPARHPTARLVLHRGTTASGRVVDEAGRPVAGATVTMDRDRDTLEPSGADPGPFHVRALSAGLLAATSDATGRFELRDLPTGWLALEVAQPGFHSYEQEHVEVVPGASRLDLGRIVLGRGVSTEGTVTSSDGRPLSGAVIRWRLARRGESPRLARPDARVVAGPDGRFTIRDLDPNRSVELWTQHAGFAAEEAESVPAGGPPVCIRLEPARPPSSTAREELGVFSDDRSAADFSGGLPLRGRVVDAAGRGLKAVLVTAWRNGGGVLTSADGTFTLEMPRGSFELAARGEGFVPMKERTIEVGDGGATVEIRLARGATLSGRLQGAPFDQMGRVRLTASRDGMSRSTRVDRAGRYVLRGLPPGSSSQDTGAAEAPEG